MTAWMQGRRGRPIDLVRPTPADVDFRDIADQLAQINRYCGAAAKPISVAQHTLIACAAAPLEAQPWVALHDAHEARINDLTTPLKLALAEVADGLVRNGGRLIRAALSTIALRHDEAIHAAAGLPLPDVRLKEAIKRADIVALQTERRDFVGPCARAWAPEIEAVRPLRAVYRLRPAADVADDLYALFRRCLPALMESA